MTDKNGDIPFDNTRGLGLYTKDTRFLSQMELWINQEKPILLSSSADENYVARILLTNPHIEKNGEVLLWRESLEIERTRFIFHDILYETVKLSNFNPKPIQFDLSLTFAADFKDMFIVRGYNESTNGTLEPLQTEDRQMRFRYHGTDHIMRETKIEWDMEHTCVSDNGKVTFHLQLQPTETQEITFSIMPIVQQQEPMQLDRADAFDQLTASYKDWNARTTRVKSDLATFDKLYNRGLQDLRVLMTDIGYGPFPVAGLPLFAVPFGRDSLIAALQMLPVNPEIAKGTLRTMAATQGTKIDTWTEEQPGKIMHEMRYGELANKNQIPFTPYYGTIDATPLFLVVVAEYFTWTRDLQLMHELLPAIKKALSWIDKYGDRDGDGFVEYYQESSKGIANQGWKDSADSVVHENGEFAKAPIALAEVQGYVYHAKTKLAPILRLMNHTALANQIEREAKSLKEKFLESFWMEDHQYFAIALDRDKRQVRSVTSNPGHVLMSGMLKGIKAEQVAKRLVADDMFSGYGIRTMSTQSSGYNPMSYHDGSVWPHDNALCLLGLGRLDFKDEACTIMSGLLEASESFEYHRLPELFCGYERLRGYAVPYPVACSPQAWAAGTPLVFLQTMLGITLDSVARTISFNPILPDGMNNLEVEQLAVGSGHLSLHVSRKNLRHFHIEILSNTSEYKIKHDLTSEQKCI